MACDAMKLSVTVYLAAQLQQWRNESPDSMKHKVVGGLGFAGIAILGVIETVVRGILSLIALPFIYCLPESQKDLKEALVYLPMGSLFSAAVAAACFASTFGSCCTDETINIDAVVPNCMGALYQDAGKHFQGVIDPAPARGAYNP